MTNKKILLLIVILSSCSFGGDEAPFDYIDEYQSGCGFNGHIHIIDFPLYRPSNQATELLEDIYRYVSINKNFDLSEDKLSKVEIAFTNMRKGRRQIIYNQAFLEGIEGSPEKRWQAIFVFAHEIGHHVQGHMSRSSGDYRNEELEADEFAGNVIGRMGGDKDDVLSAINQFANNGQPDRYPPKFMRREAALKGWVKAIRDIPVEEDDFFFPLGP